jgi:Mg2+ and Co2+ transporter CorA
VMKHSIKQDEYSTDSLLEIQAFTNLESDLLALQVWGRRCLQTLQKIRSVIKFLKTYKSKEPKDNAFEMIVEDYEHLAALADAYGRRLETIVPVVTSLVQIADTRRSLKEATNITRLTNLALLFVPLSFVTGLFSMNNGVSAHGLKLYFAVAVPLCRSVLLCSSSPIHQYGRAFSKASAPEARH